MKRFIIKILIWILPVLLLSIPADWFLSYWLKKSNYYAHDEFSVWNDLYGRKINAEIAVYGSSRAWVHIDPLMLQDSLGHAAYNLGIDGHNFWLQHLRHTLLMKYNKVPGTIIFSLDVFTLQKKTELYNPDQFLPYMLWNWELKNYVETYEGYATYDYYLPLVRYYGKRQAIRNAIANSIIPVNPDSGRTKGFMGMNLDWNDDFANATSKIDFYEVKTDPATIILFEEFLDECKQKGINVIFVYTPEYINGQKFVKNRNEIIGMYTEMARNHNLLFLDYSADTICLERKYFYNASHLTKTGAHLFTAKLIRDIKAAKASH